jgi:hypothetical protein
LANSLRAQIKAALKPLLPNSWDIYDYETDPTVETRPALVIRSRSITQTPAAPGSSYTVSFVLSLYEPKTDPSTREDALEEKLSLLTAALADLPGLVWTSADKALAPDNSHLIYDIALTVLN